MYSNDMPKNDFLEIQTGVYSENYSKNIIFSPKILINFNYGCHSCSPVGTLRPHSETFALFHYRNIGGHKRLSERHELYRKRMSEHNRFHKLGHHYLQDERERQRNWQENYNRSTLFDPKRLETLPV